ncbi:hypothetical protein HIM_11892 [Hirsutella minnesotensis 3608]|uniref:Uncharacterized protein n=1 Tax=Hirsutella minnesotensis 3608 TaxID=1043627 RepID=A0A0F8A0P1_9HYPO|nr:hypothetical protein HIM_11892 [Hirsutella minnesotensis 3608]
MAESRWILPDIVSVTDGSNLPYDDSTITDRLHLPWLSIEMLKENPSVLFALLHLRSSHPPENWAAFDNAHLHYQWRGGYLSSNQLNRRVVMHGCRYGKIVELDSPESKSMDCAVLSWSRADLVLKSQSTLLRTLLDITSKIVSSLKCSEVRGCAKWEERATQGFDGDLHSGLWSCFTNQAISEPNSLDLAHFASIARTQREVHADLLEDLQIEPKVLRDFIKDLLKSCSFKKLGCFSVAERLTAHIRLLVELEWHWSWVEANLAVLSQIHDENKTTPDVKRALGAMTTHLEEVLRLTLKGCYIDLVTETASIHPELRDLAKPKENDDHLASKNIHRDHPLAWCLKEIIDVAEKAASTKFADFRPGYPLGVLSLGQLLAFLYDSLKKNPHDAKYLSERLMHSLSDLEAVQGILDRLEIHRPVIPCRSLDECVREEQGPAWKMFRSPKKDVAATSIETELKQATQNLMDTFYTPGAPSGPRNMEWLHKTQVQRQAIEAFWEALREEKLEKCRHHDFSEQECAELTQGISAHLRPEYRETQIANDEAVLKAIERNQAQPQTPFFPKTVTNHAPSSQIILPTRSEKPKTRSATEHSDATVPVDRTEPPKKQLSLVKIQLRPRSWEAFDLLFPDLKGANASHLAWTEFVAAMADAGFVASEGSGSAVRFERPGTAESSNRTIVFHRPHPKPVLCPIQMRSVARRLTRHFGWTRESFVCLGRTSNVE